MRNNSDNEINLIDYLSKHFEAVDTLEHSCMLTGEDIADRLDEAGIGRFATSDINRYLSESMGFQFKSIPGNADVVWLLKEKLI